MPKRIPTYLALIIGLTLFQGCANHSNFAKKQDQWVGKKVTEFIDKVGYPDSTFILPNKHKVYVYEKSTNRSAPSTMISYGYGGGYGGLGLFNLGYSTPIQNYTCKLFIETNKKGKIVKWGSRGNHCVSN